MGDETSNEIEGWAGRREGGNAGGEQAEPYGRYSVEGGEAASERF